VRWPLPAASLHAGRRSLSPLRRVVRHPPQTTRCAESVRRSPLNHDGRARTPFDVKRLHGEPDARRSSKSFIA
jgi:hypothetical protein